MYKYSLLNINKYYNYAIINITNVIFVTAVNHFK